MIEKLNRYRRNGAWSSPHNFHFRSAYIAFREFERKSISLQKAEKSLREKFGPEIKDYELGGHPSLRRINVALDKAAIDCHVHSCMTIEAFVNHYGVRRFGEEFYKSNMERMGIVEKIAVILAACHHVLLPRSHKYLKLIRRMFDLRNSMVHPKTREYRMERSNELIQDDPKEMGLSKSLIDMDGFLWWFCSLDTDIDYRWEFEHNIKVVDGKVLKYRKQPSAKEPLLSRKFKMA
jgi:hypothetical protein